MNFSKTAKDLLHSDQRCERERLTGGIRWHTGPTRQRDRDRGDARRRRNSTTARSRLDPRALCVALLKADSVTYFTRALLDPRVLVVVNGGSAALRAIRRRAQPMPSRLRFTPSISEPKESDRDKNGEKWWSREAWPRRRWARAELRRGRMARSSAMPPYPCSTVAKEVMPR